MKIYRPDGKLWREVVALDSSFCEETLERFNRISLDFVLAEEVLVPELCYVTWRGERYSLFSTPKVVKVSTREYRYTLNLEGRHLELDRVLVKDKLGRTKFVFTGRTDQYAELISDCLPSWKVGACTTGDATRVIAFNNTSLLEACRMVASKFETEVQLTDGAISFGRVERYKSDPLLLAYRNGLKKDITVEPDPKETAIGRLYVVGGDRNIDPAKYGGHQLHLPKGGKVSVGGRTFVADAEGRYISLEGDTRLNTSERTFDASSVYPKRVGTVSKVEQVSDEWDVLDDANTIDYGQHRVGGDTMRLEFQSGRLAGRTFDLATKDDKLVGYVHSEKRFKLVRKEIDGVLMPEPTTFYPAVGDKYAIFGCSLPDEYITSAEGEMLLRGAEYMAERLEPRLQYRAELDGLWAKKNWGTVAHKLVVGTIVRLEGASSEVRISSVRTSLNSPYTPRITFSNAPYMVGSLATQIATLENAEVRQREELRAGLVKLQDRTYKDTEAVREMVEKLKLEGFSKSLKPETLQTMYAVIGSPALQFEFVGGGFSWTEGKGGAITIPRQTIRQRVAGTTLEPNPKTIETTIPALTYTLKPHEQQAHIYVELKPTPRYVVSTKPLEITPDRLLVGLLNGTEGSRDFTPLYGFTEISPSHIATRYIRSRSGNMLIDLETGNIYSDKIEFRRPDGSTKDIDQVISESVQVGGRNLAVMSRMVPGYLRGDLNAGNPGDVDYKVVQYYPFNYDPTYYPIEEGAKLVYVIKRIVNPERNAHAILHWYNENKEFIGWDFGKWRHPNGTPRVLTAPKGTHYYRFGFSDYPKRIQVKLERGTVATDWSPAPEDVQADIEAVERGYQKLIERVDVEFAISNSRDTAPTSGWQTNAPTPARGQALWQRTKVYLKDGTTEVRGVTCIQGKDGAKGGDGADGRGITKIVELYYLSSSNTALANGAWSETAPTPKEGFWIWTKTRIHYTTGEQIETQPICVTGNKGDKGDRGERGLQGLQGKDGTDGLPGRDGVDGKTSYTHIAYADTVTGGGFSQSPTGKAYIGMYVDFVQADSSDPKKYAWSLIKGADGKNGLNGKDGVPGKPGADGRTPYLHIAYANSQDGKQGFSVSVSEGKSYIGTYTDYTQADSTDPTKYSWSRIKGDKGDKGDDGKDVDPKLLEEINAGLSNANTLIATLEKTAKELKEGKLDTKDLPDLQYLLNALQKGDTKIAGGLVLSKIIALSNQVNRITAYLSGYDGTSGDGKILRAGIQYTKTKKAVWPIGRFLADYCGYKNLGTAPHVNNVITKEALFTWLRQQKEPFEKFNKALSGGTVSFNPSINSSSINLLRINAIIYSHSDSNSEAVAIRHDGTGHFGDIHLNGDRIDYKKTQDANPYLTVGRGTYGTIEEVIRKNDYRAYNPSNITNKSFYYNPDWNTGDEQVSTVEIEVANDNTKVTITVELMKVDTKTHAKNPEKPGWVHTELQAKLNGHHIKGVMEMYNYGYTKEMPADPEYSSEHWDSNREPGRPTDETERREWRLVKGNKSSRSVEHSVILPKGTHQLEFVFTQVASSDKHSLPATARVEGIKVLQEFKTDFKQALISPTGARFYGGRDRYFDINYNAYSNAPTAQLTGGLKVDYIDMPGVPLCGAMVTKSGTVVKSFGRYKNKRGEGFPRVSYSYSTRTYTVYHSIPHSNYIPMLTVGNCHYSDQANYRNISAYSFDVNITNYQMAYQQQDFSYICFLSE